MDGKKIDIEDLDMLFKKAARVVVAAQIGSTSLLQRKLNVSYRRACHLMVQLKTAGIVGEFSFDRPRDVLIKSEEGLQLIFARMKPVLRG